MEARMAGIDELIQRHRPHLVALQEVTPRLWQICSSLPGFAQLHWSPCPSPSDQWKGDLYFTLLGSAEPLEAQRADFKASCGKHNPRDLLQATVQLGDQKLVVGTAHLDSLAEDGTKTSKSVSREQQVVELVEHLSQAADHQDADALWIGDTNWVDAQDGPLQIPAPWVDVWCTLRPGEAGATYDLDVNTMANAKGTGRKFGMQDNSRHRYDRCFGRFGHLLQMRNIQLVGTEPLKQTDDNNEKIWPSDHFGLLVTLSRSLE